MRKYKNTTILSKFFGSFALILIVGGVVMEIFDLESSFTLGPTYESVNISGLEVIWIGVGMLVLILGFYLLKGKVDIGPNDFNDYLRW